ncbi:MAG: hypothetical protein COA58_16415 [Bacteroidetes bacterium]|nr:MAG: hypothetical protein COA58_16415 [Bacteroidota bacterium]
MNTHSIESHLKNQKYDFDANFCNDILRTIKESKNTWIPKLQWLITGIAASLIFCLAFIYFQDGTISYDSVLGLANISDDNLTDYLNYL